MDIRKTCCSVDKNPLSYPSFSVVFIHTFMADADVVAEHLPEAELSIDRYREMMTQMKRKLKKDPKEGDVPVSSLAEFSGMNIVRMNPEVERLVFPESYMRKENEQIARYSLRGFDFRIPVRSDVEIGKDGKEKLDFDPIDLQGHVNVEVSQFFGNIFSLTYRFLFDGFTCRILEADLDDDEHMGRPGRKSVEAETNHIISLLSSCLGAEYWTGDDDEDDSSTSDGGGIDLLNSLIVDGFWLNDEGNAVRPMSWHEKSEDRVFDKVLLCYKKFLTRMFVKGVDLSKVSVYDDLRYAMVDIWETVRHPYGGNRDLFSDNYSLMKGESQYECVRFSEADIINHIRDFHKPEIVGLMTMYPAEWPYRDAEAYDDVCGENIAIDTDDLVLAGSHMAVVIGTYGRRGDGVDGVNWKEVMRDRRFYHVSWEEYLLILQLVLAKKYTFNHAVTTLLRLTDDMSDVTKAKIGECSKAALVASQKAIQLDVIKHMKFPSHKVMYDRTARRLDLETDFQSFKDVQEVVSSNLQSLGEYQAAKADSLMNKVLIAISVLSLLELAFQDSKWPFVSVLIEENVVWEKLAAAVSSLAAAAVAVLAVVGLVMGISKHIKRFKKKKND